MPPLVSEGGGLVCESVGMADLLSDHFHSKQSRRLRSSEVRRLLLDLDPYGGTDPFGMFPIFLKRIADVMALRLSVVFRRLVRLGSFPACWRVTGDRPMSPQFRKVHRPHLLPITDKLP